MTEAEPPASRRNLFSYPLFPETFASYLLHKRETWRIRRIDRFEPIDINLATHHVTLQGSIGPDLIEGFLARHAENLEIPREAPSSGEPLTLYLPSLSQPKRLLLEFSARDEQGTALPLLSRIEGAQVVARDLLGILIGGKTEALSDLESHGVALSLQTLIATVAFQNPFRLAERLRDWPDRQGAFQINRGLGAIDLEAWIRVEGEEFLPGSADAVLSAVGDVFEAEVEGRSLFSIGGVARPSALRYFPTLGSLVLHGIQDLLKNIVQAQGSWPEDTSGVGPRGRLMSDPGALAVEVRQVVEALPLLEELIARQRSPATVAEFYRHLDRWTAYVITTIRLGVPFIRKFSEALPLGPPASEISWFEEKRRRTRTYHAYPLALRDALAVHVEVAVPTPELRVDATQIVQVQGGERSIVTASFGHELRPSGRLVHRYSSRRPDVISTEDAIAESSTYLFAVIRYKLIRSVQRGYFAASLAFLLAGLYVAYSVSKALIDRRDVPDLQGLLTVAALAASLSLWLTAVQHPRPVVYRKLWAARRAFYGALILILAPLTAYYFREVLYLVF